MRRLVLGLIPAEAVGWRRCVLVLLVAYGVTFAYVSAPIRTVPAVGSWPLYLCCLLALPLLPRRAAGLAAIAGVVSLAALVVVNRIKTQIFALPVTWMDVKGFGTEPFVSIDALKLPPTLAVLVVVAGAVLVVGTPLYCLVAVLRAQGRLVRALGLAGLVPAFIMANAHLVSAATELASHTRRASWDPTVLAETKGQLGMIGFLAYTRVLADNNVGPFFEPDRAPPPSAEAVRDALSSLVTVAPKKIQPNILVILGESTFDPNDAFDLAAPFRNGLLDHGPLTHAAGPLHVTPIGGGTWVSEFEMFLGMDARLFGMRGRYASILLAPYVHASLPRHLRGLGYHTVAAYSADPRFLREGEAYAAYGFEKAFDSDDLGTTEAGYGVKDQTIVEAAFSKFPFSVDAPTFAYIQFLQNHSPHLCDPASADRTSPRRFAGAASDVQTCQLQLYLANMDDSARAVDMAIARLREVEARTGRPFVVLIFGDHQPHSFTGTGSGLALADYTALRRTDDLQRTIFHVSGSAPNILHLPGDRLPLALMPTLISAYAANHPDEVYLPVNALAFRRCGTDPLSASAAAVGAGGVPEKNGDCAFAPALLAAYHAAGNIRLAEERR